MKKLKTPLIALGLLIVVTSIGYATMKFHYRLPPPTYGNFVPHLVRQHVVKTNEKGEVLQTEDWNVYLSSEGAARRVQWRYDLRTGKSDVIEYIVRPSAGTFLIFHSSKTVERIKKPTGQQIQHLPVENFTYADNYLGSTEVAGVTAYRMRLENGAEVWRSPDYGLVELYYKETSGNITIERTTVSIESTDEANVYVWPDSYQTIDGPMSQASGNL